MSYLVKSSSGIYYYSFSINGVKHRKSLRTRDRAMAKRLQKILDARQEEARAGLTPKKTPILEEALSRHIDARAVTARASTITRYKIMAGHLVRLLPPKGITLFNINEFIRIRQIEKAAPKTISEELSLFKAATGLKMDYPRIKRTAVRPETLGFYSVEEVEALKKYFYGGDFYPVFMFAIYTGCRISEIQNAKWSDVKSGTLRIESLKTESNIKNQFRIIPLHPELEKILAGLDQRGDYIFPVLKSKDSKWSQRQMIKACKALRIQYKRVHGLRHTTATFLLDAGLSLRDVMQILGWTRLETAQKYIHYNDAKNIDISKLPY